MKEAELIGSLLPSHPDIIPIIKEIRKKYNIPEIYTEDNELLEILFLDEVINWKQIREDIEAQIRTKPDLIPEQLANVSRFFNNEDVEPPELKNRSDVPDDIRNLLTNSYAFLRSIFKPVDSQLEEFYSALTDRVIEFLMTGKSREIPEGWVGTVYTTSFLGNPTIVAMVGQLGDPKEISAQFRRKFTETFGHSRPKISNENLNTARFLTLKLSGMKLKDIIDIYIEQHPSEFPKDINSSSYKEARRKHQIMFKKRIQRLQDTIIKICGDNN